MRLRLETGAHLGQGGGAMNQPRFLPLVPLFLASALAGCAPPEPPFPPPPPDPPRESETAKPAPSTSAAAVAAPAPGPGEALRQKTAQFARAKITADVGKLPPEERAALDKLIAASRLLDAVFERQAYADNPKVRAALQADTSPEGKAKLEYFEIMRGPWDRQDEFKPFAIDRARPKGAGFYPEDLTADAFQKWVKDHPADKKALEGLFTIVVREKDALKAVPFSQAYAEWLKPSAALLVEAAKLTKNKSLSKFLKSRAAAFGSDDYYVSDKDWMDLDSLVEITIGPYETYEDNLFEMKASFESFVTVADPDASSRLAKYKKLLPEMEKNLPVPEEIKTKRGAESPIRVVDLVFASGDARKSVQTIAFNLPNDEKVRAEKGAKKVLLRNVIQTKFDLIMRPIAERIIAQDQLKHLSSEAFFNETLFHELSHSLGPAFTKVDGKKVEVRFALQNTHSAIEEAKADVMGAYNVLFMTKRGEFPQDFREKLLLSYFAGLFRSTRFGVAEAHGKGAALQINRFLEAGAARFDEASGRFTVDFAKLETAIAALVRDICVLQHEGNKAAAEAMLARYGGMSDPMTKALGHLEGIPVDIRPSYPLAGE